MAANDDTWVDELEDLLKVESGLSDWEVNFVDDVSERVKNIYFNPSEPQKGEQDTIK